MDISIVIPIKDEEQSVEELIDLLGSTLSALGRSYEIIAVDDGSRDGTFAVLEELLARVPELRVVRLRTNFGQTAALAAGFAQSRGEIVVTIDADLQNDPADIPRLISRMEEGYDVVSGWRRRRKDPFLTRRIPSRIANWLISRITGVHLHDYGCTLKAYRREVIDNIDLYGEMHRFMPALARWVGAEISEIEVGHSARRYGRSNYGISRTIRVILDLVTVRFLLSYSTRPIHIFGLMGIISGGVGFLLAAVLLIQRQFFQKALADRPMLLLAVLLILLGFIFISMGLLGELQVRTYHESQGKPIYVVREIREGKKEDEEGESGS